MQHITVSKAIGVLGVAFGVILLFTAIISRLLPDKYILLLATILIGFSTLFVFVLFIGKTNKLTKNITTIIALLTIVIYAMALFGLVRGMSFIHNVTNNSSVVKKDIVTSAPFNLYISGIDTYGDITTISRSDVNIIASVNPQKRHILLTTVPRDSYVRIAGGGNDQYDKLTHSGIYGIESSTQTMAQLLNINVDTYMRVNFTSLIKIVDQINGIDVNNPVGFETDYHDVFKKGTIHLNGEDALTFSRERHNLSGGDNDRGMNQERVVTGIFNKITKPSILNNYLGVLRVLGDSVQTNVSQSSITALVNQLINDGRSWKIDTQSISGHGETGELPSYAMPNNSLYMFVLDQKSLAQAQARIITAQHTTDK